MEAQPAPIGSRDLLRPAKEGHEQEEHQISIDPRLQLQVARVILGMNLPLAGLELERGVERVVYFLHERNQRTDVAVAQAGPRIVLLS